MATGRDSLECCERCSRSSGSLDLFHETQDKLAVNWYPSGQPRPDTRGVRDLQRLSNGQVSERRPGERGGGDFRRAAA